VWEFATKQRVDGSPVVVGQRVFVGSADGRLYALNLMDGKESWQFEGEGGFLGSPAVADNRLVIATDRGVVYCLGEKRN
jgi:outer membrane protein assembly factor BamB